MRRRRQLLGALLKKLFVPVKVLEAILIEHNLAWVANRQLMRSEHKLPSGRCCTWLWYCCAGWRQKLPMRRVVSSYTGAQGEMCFRVAEVSIQCDRCETQWRRWMHRARTGPRVAPTVSNAGFCSSAFGKSTGPVRSIRSSQQDNCAANLESCRPAVKWFYF